MTKTIIITALLLLITLLPASSLKSTEEVIFYDSFGYYQNGKIHLTVHGQVFDKKEKSGWRSLMTSALKKFITAKDSNDIFVTRLKPFLYDNRGNKILNINLNGENYSLNFTGADGHTVNEIIQDSSRYPVNKPALLYYSMLPTQTNPNRYSGRIKIISGPGLTVISDIDDTIKESNVADKKELLKNTFEKEYLPITGMPALFDIFKRKKADFHYLSASPWQLYRPLSEFISQNYPQGQLHLKKFRLKDSSIIDFIFQNQEEYKYNELSAIIEKQAKRNFILVGDTGEKDPEIFAQIAQAYPNKIASVYLRLSDKKRTADDIRRIFSGNKSVQLFLFTHPAELQGAKVE